MVLTRDELRELICKYKAEGMTFERISEIIEEDYGVKRDRQSIYGIYKRYMDRLEKDKDMLRYDIDIINIAARNTYFSNIKKQVMEMDNSITERYIKEAIESYKDDIKEVEDEMIDIVDNGIRTGSTKEEIMKSISYKGIEPTDKVYVKLAAESFKRKIIDGIELVIAQSIKHNENTDIAKELIKEFNTGSSVTVIKNKYT